MSTSFNFANKENASHLSRAAPKTPLNSKSIIFKNNNNNNNNANPKKIPVLSDGLKTPNNNVDPRNQKRVPLGGKDKNTQIKHNSLKISAGSLNDHHQHKGGLTSSAAKRRIRRLRNTPLSNRPPSKKLNVLRDEPLEIEAKNDAPMVIDDDDEIEYVPEKEPALPFVPLNYDPFTEEELEQFRTASNPRTFDCRDDIVPMTEAEVYEEFPISFESESESETHSIASTEKSIPHFMEPTFVSSARSKQSKKFEVYDEGLSITELQRIIDED